MSSPKSVDYVRCMKCGKILKCSRYDVPALLDHIRTDHPEIDIIDTETKRKRHFYRAPSNTGTPIKIEDCSCTDEECVRERPGRSCSKLKLVKDTDLSHYSATSEILAKYPEIKECEYTPHNLNAQVAYTRRYKLSTPSVVSESHLQQPFQYTLYRTSIEKWCPANGTISCPKCGCNKRPLIKTKAERFTSNECGACCLLSCWPFCFIPWILPGQNQEYLYCANCKTFLGLYDPQRNCLKPNRLYSASSNSGPKPPEQVTKIKSNQTKSHKVLENESPPAPSLATNSAKSTRVSSIIVNGKELPPEAVARIEKYKHLGALMGIDLKALTDTPNSTNRRHEANKETETAAPSDAKENRIEKA